MCWGESLWVVLVNMHMVLWRGGTWPKGWAETFWRGGSESRCTSRVSSEWVSNKWYGLIQKEKVEQREAQRMRDLQLFIYLTWFICDLMIDHLHLLFSPPGQRLKCAVRFAVCVWINTLWHIVIQHWRVNLWLDLSLWSTDSMWNPQSIYDMRLIYLILYITH